MSEMLTSDRTKQNLYYQYYCLYLRQSSWHSTWSYVLVNLLSVKYDWRWWHVVCNMAWPKGVTSRQAWQNWEIKMCIFVIGMLDQWETGDGGIIPDHLTEHGATNDQQAGSTYLLYLFLSFIICSCKMSQQMFSLEFLDLFKGQFMQRINNEDSNDHCSVHCIIFVNVNCLCLTSYQSFKWKGHYNVCV